MQETKKTENTALKMYGEECTLSKEDFIKKFKVKEKGLTSKEAENRLHSLGFNEIKQAKPKKWYNYLLSSLFSPFNAILLGITLVLFYTDVFLPETPSFANIIVIIILILASTFLEFFEVYRSNKSAEKLKALVATTCSVIRNGKEIKIESFLYLENLKLCFLKCCLKMVGMLIWCLIPLIIITINAGKYSIYIWIIDCCIIFALIVKISLEYHKFCNIKRQLNLQKKE